MPTSIAGFWALDSAVIAFTLSIFLFGAFIKGAIGVGLPLVAIPVLSMFIPPQQAIGLLALPVLASNALQAFEGGPIRPVIQRMGWLLAAQFVTMFVTVWWTTEMSPDTLRPLVGGSVLLAAALLAYKPGFRISAVQERWWSVAVGAAAGFVGGVSSLTGPVVIAYLMALSLKRDAFVGHVSVIYFFTAVPMYATMLWFGRFGTTEMLISCIAMIPMLIGLRLGKRVRQYLNEVLFRRILVSCLVLLGLLLIR